MTGISEALENCRQFDLLLIIINPALLQAAIDICHYVGIIASSVLLLHSWAHAEQTLHVCL